MTSGYSQTSFRSVPLVHPELKPVTLEGMFFNTSLVGIGVAAFALQVSWEIAGLSATDAWAMATTFLGLYCANASMTTQLSIVCITPLAFRGSSTVGRCHMTP